MPAALLSAAAASAGGSGGWLAAGLELAGPWGVDHWVQDGVCAGLGMLGALVWVGGWSRLARSPPSLL